MSVVAPVTAVSTAALPVLGGLVLGERIGPRTLTGIALALVAVVLVAAEGGLRSLRTARPVGLLRALSSGAGFGLFFVLLDRADVAAGGNAGLWPIAAAQLGALTVGGALLLRSRLRAGPGRPAGALLGWVAVTGVLDMTANALYLTAVRDGMLSLVAPVASLYPVSTVLLALAIDRERVRATQVAGLGLAVAALVLVAS